MPQGLVLPVNNVCGHPLAEVAPRIAATRRASEKVGEQTAFRSGDDVDRCDRNLGYQRLNTSSSSALTVYDVLACPVYLAEPLKLAVWPVTVIRKRSASLEALTYRI